MCKHCSLEETYLKFTHLIGPGLKSPEENTLQYLEEVAVQTAKYVVTALSLRSENNLIVICTKVNGSVNFIPVLIVASVVLVYLLKFSFVFLFYRSLASGSLKPDRSHSWANMKGALRNEEKKILAIIYIHVIGQILNHNGFFNIVG